MNNTQSQNCNSHTTRTGMGWGGGGQFTAYYKSFFFNLQHFRAAVSQTSVSVAWAHVSVPGTQATPRSFAAPSAPKRETATLQQTVTAVMNFFFFFFSRRCKHSNHYCVRHS